MLVKPDGEYELYIDNQSDGDTESAPVTVVYFNDRRPLEEEFANLVSFWKGMLAKAKSKQSPMKFDYIDVRSV